MKKKISIMITLLMMVSIIQGSLFANTNRMLKLGCAANSQGMKYAEKQNSTMSMDIVDIAAGDDRFETLVAALKAAELVDTLKGNGPFTVFAPTDDAFAKLPAGTLEELLKPENKDTLVNILTYHVVAGRVPAEEALKLDGKEITMVNGDKAKIEVKDGSVFINGAKVIVTDIMAKNGIIHAIDTVIMPPTNRMKSKKTN
ncbi:fasciclin domain-containing protein [Cellulosilyticum sp. I15G10I2]|uniref:fasciclin domain-containing protein n=1 Tax=Cellulosilyticum sp. I15G10I2 TaxID=1892843 RepID=UPI00085C85B4|nr:fasciclin domain-containing protein [Cellulosilyticum sp. I15G10I2]